MYLSRRYVVALLVAIVGLAGYLAVPKVSSAIHARDARDALVTANASFSHLKVPADFVALTSDPNCQWYPCYRVPRPTTSVVADLPGILKSTGAVGDETPRQACLGAPRRGSLCAVYGISHGYQVLITLGPPPPDCSTRPCRRHLNQSIVQITRPYIPEDSEPWNSGSGWPVS